MKYSVGYGLQSDTEFIESIANAKEHIKEVYFSWWNFPNGRNIQVQNELYTPWEAQRKQEDDIAFLHNNGIKFNLLFNGNCYGKDSMSRDFFISVGNAIDYIASKYSLDSVTTTSPLIAKFIKNNFDTIKVRASVNMNIGTVQGMDYIAEYFDGYYMKREYNRNFDKIKELKSWCDSNSKKLFILANSGCLNNCSAHTFHDNLVAHESDIKKMDNAYEFTGICHEYLQNPQKRVSLVRDTSFIRPEDVKLYKPYFSSMKLATRVSDKPELILKSYINGHYAGNILELLEPNHSGRIYPYVIDNGKLDSCYYDCDKNCSSCSKCELAYNNALINLEEEHNVNE